MTIEESPYASPQYAAPDPQYGGYPQQQGSFQQGYGDQGYAQQQDYAPQPTPEDIEKRYRHLAKKERRKKEKETQAQSAIGWLLVLGVLAALFWLIPAFGNSWISKHFGGFGVKSLFVSTSLLNIEVTLDCGSKLGYESLKAIDLEQKVCKVFKIAEGTHSLRDGADSMCVTGGSFHPSSCVVMQNIYYMSFVPLICFPLACICQLIGVLMLYFYYYVEQRSKIRKWAFVMNVMAPILGGGGFLFYSAMVPNIATLVSSWAELAPSFFELTDVEGFPFGWCWFFSLFTILWSVVIIFVHMAFVGKHPNERKADLEEWRQKELAWDMVNNMEKQDQFEPLMQGPGGGHGQQPYYQDEPYSSGGGGQQPYYQEPYPPGGQQSFQQYPGPSQAHLCSTSAQGQPGQAPPMPAF